MKKYLYGLVITLLIIVGGGCYYIQSTLSFTDNPQIFNLFGNLGSAILICGILTLLQTLITKKYEEDNLRKLLGISVSIKLSKLKIIMTDSSEYNYKDVLTKSSEFHAIMNDGLRWVGNNSSFLELRFNKKATETEVFLVNPEGEFCKALAVKTDKSLEDLKSKINQTVQQLESTYNRSKKNGRLRIYYLKNYPTQTLFYTDDSVIVTPYQTSSGRSIIPLYEYEYEENDVSIASHLFKDLKNVQQESKLISENGTRVLC